MYKILQLALARAKEPSTFASIGVLLAAVGINIPDEIMTNIVTIIGGVAALLGVLMKEKGES